MDHLYLQLKSCEPCSADQIQTFFQEIPVEIAEDMTEFDRKLFVDQLNSAGTIGIGAGGL